MSFAEVLRQIRAHITKKGQEPLKELFVGKNVQFWDLREPKAAEERGVEPGYYLTTQPISQAEVQDPQIIYKLSILFHQKLQEAGLQEKSGTQIPVDTKYTMFVDPAQGWLFSPAGYIPDLQMLVVRADKINPDENQRMLVGGLNKRI